MSEARKKQIEEVLRILAADRSSEDAWTSLYKAVYPYVAATLFRALSGRSDETYDLAQEVFIRLVRFCEFPAFPNADAFLGYVHAICLNLARDLLRKHSLPVSIDNPDLMPGRAGQHELVDLKLMLNKVFKDLDPEELALTEYLLRGYNLKEISEITKQTYGSLAVRVHRLKAKLEARTRSG